MKSLFEKKIELRVLSTLKGLLEPMDHLLVAVSGGVDSVCLLHLLSRWAKKERWRIKVAHFDHALRPTSQEDEKFVYRLSETYGFPYVTERGDVTHFKKEREISLEEAARYCRYDFLGREAKKFNDAKIVLAHHQDDQIETFFLHLLKGGGPGGLSGMKLKNQNKIRPLLNVTKEEITRYAQFQRLEVVNDLSNEDPSYLRNRIRLKLIPFLKKEFNWNFYKTLPRLMNILKGEHEVLDQMIEVWMNQHLRVGAQEISCEVESFLGLPAGLQRLIIKNVLDRFSVNKNYSSQHVELNRRLFGEQMGRKKLHFPEGVVAERVKKRVLWTLHQRVSS